MSRLYHQKKQEIKYNKMLYFAPEGAPKGADF
jgi:hypothetical protein